MNEGNKSQPLIGYKNIAKYLVDRTREEEEYWEAFKSGEPMGDLKAPPMVIEPDRSLWQQFRPHCPALETARRAIIEWYNNRLQVGGGLILAGNCGSGKTHLAKAIRDLHIMRVKYWSEISLIKSIQDSFGNKNTKSKTEILHTIDRAELFILDDLGAYQTDNTEWMHTIYMDLFDARCDEKRPFLITTNLSEDEILPRVGERVTSRLIGALGEKRFFVDLFEVGDYRMRGFG